MTIRPLDGSKPRLTVDVPAQPEVTKPASQGPTSTSQGSLPGIDSTFADAKKKLMSLGKTNTRLPPVARNGGAPAGTLQVKDLQRAQGATKSSAPTLDAAGKQALKAINASKDKSATAISTATISLPPDQQLAVFNALPKATRAALVAEFNKDPSKILGGLAVAITRSMSNAELAAAQKALRTRGPASPGPGDAAIGAELAARTKWGAANAAVVTQLREKLSAGQVSWEAGRGRAHTDPATGDITLDPKLAGSPEGLAAVLAHEGTHSADFKGGGTNDLLTEEVLGNRAGAEVFAQLKGDPKDPKLPDGDGAGLEAYGKLLDQPDAFRARVASMYAGESGLDYAAGNEKKTNRNRVDLLVEKLASEPATLKAMTAEQFDMLLGAVERTHPGDALQLAVTKFGQLLENAPADVQKHVRETAKHDMGATGLEVLDAAMKK
ncbi:MAG: hypothetical protein U0228_06750 [Myxococcaceae bacterium]